MLYRPFPVALLLWITLISGASLASAQSTLTDITLDCEPSGVTLTVNASGVEPESLRVGEGPWHPQCRPREGEDTGRGIRVFTFLYGDCHPQVEELTNTMLRLTYSVSGDVIDGDEDSPGVATATCMIPKDGLIHAKIESDTNTYEYAGSADGPFAFDITIYKDSFMTVPVQKDEEIALGMPLWVGVKLNSSTSDEMFVRDCWATPNPTNTPDQPEHIFIRNGIIGEDDETFNPMDDVITATTYGFTFDSFMFRGAGNRIYIKCHVHVCNSYVTDTDQSGCTIPKYPEFHIATRAFDEDSGSGSGFGVSLDARDVIEEERDMNDENENSDDGENENRSEDEAGTDAGAESDKFVDSDGDAVAQMEQSVYYVMNSFQVKHVERKRRSAGSYRIYPRHTMFSNLRSGIMLGIIIASTAMFSACAILLPLHLSGEKVRCLHVKPVKRVV